MQQCIILKYGYISQEVLRLSVSKLCQGRNNLHQLCKALWMCYFTKAPFVPPSLNISFGL